MKIRTAIFGVYVAASAIGLVGMMALVLRDVRLRYVESMRRTLGDTAAYLAAFAAPSSPGEDWTRKLSALPPRAERLRVFACAADGTVIFDSAGRDVGQIYRWEGRGGGPAASENYAVANVAEVAGELRVAARVRDGERLLGWMGVARPLASIAEGVNSARWRLVWSVGMIAAFMILAGWWIAARLTRSLERLTGYVREVRDGRDATPPATRAAEIATLGAAFEEMRSALAGRREMERYTQALAHEVKAPLAAIRGAAELLDEQMPEEQRRRFLANIRAESERINRIVTRLLELSSLEARKTLAQAERLDPADLAAEAVESVRGAYHAAGVELRFGSNRGAHVRGEQVLLRESLVNLLQNALEFSGRGSVVTATIVTQDSRIVFVVEDHGPGVPDYALPKVFDRFFSLPRPGTGRKSTGLGLTLVREIAQLHGGDAVMENRSGGGARASFWVPRAD